MALPTTMQEYIVYVLGALFVAVIVLWTISWWSLRRIYQDWEKRIDQIESRHEGLKLRVSANERFIAKQLTKDEIIAMHGKQTDKIQALEDRLSDKIEAVSNNITARLDTIINRQHNQRPND